MYKSQKVIIVAFYIHSPSWQVSCILFASNSDASVLEVEFVEGERAKYRIFATTSALLS